MTTKVEEWDNEYFDWRVKGTDIGHGHWAMADSAFINMQQHLADLKTEYGIEFEGEVVRTSTHTKRTTTVEALA